MKMPIAWLIAGILTAVAAQAGELPEHVRLFDLAAGETDPLSRVLPKLSRKRVILVGELHSEKAHHDAQLGIIQALVESGVPVAVGFEMFQKDSQNDLDRWITGEMRLAEFQRLYYDNWNFPWDLYRDLFAYAREKKVPMVGLNVPRDITRQVAREGFESLTDEQRGRLPAVACRVDKKYMDFIRKAFGAHAHGQLDFTHFCEAQLVWDTAMAINALGFLDAHPDHILVLVTGSGHARKLGIPDQIRQRAHLPLAVILPEIPGVIDPETVGVEDADYLYRLE